MNPINIEIPKLDADLQKTVEFREQMKAAGRTVVLTNGVFDLLHAGHLFFLRNARNLGGALIVALNSDNSVRQLKGPNRPITHQDHRAYGLDSLSCVDRIIMFERKRLTEEIRALKPDVYCKAGDYTLDKLDPDERRALEEVGAEIKFMPFLVGFSTTSLIARIKAAGEV